MPLKKGSSKAMVSANIREMRTAGYPEKQAVAASLNQARKSGEKPRHNPIKNLGNYAHKSKRGK